MIISLSSQTITDLISYPSQIFTDLWVVIALAIGLNIGFYVIGNVIDLLNFEDADGEGESRDGYHENEEGEVVGKLPQFVVDARRRKGEIE